MTWEEMNWLARWAVVRGVNLLFPHAFYYSVRGPRWDERPPDVGPHSAWWDRFSDYSLACRRFCWINTDAQPVCHLAILGKADYLPWHAAKQCYIHHYDFNYVEERDLLGNETVNGTGFQLAGMKYQALIVEHNPTDEVKRALEPLTSAGRVFRYSDDIPVENLLVWLAENVPSDLRVTPQTPALRFRHVVKDQHHYYMIFNEELAPIDFSLDLAIRRPWLLFDAVTGRADPLPEGGSLHLNRYELKILITQAF